MDQLLDARTKPLELDEIGRGLHDSAIGGDVALLEARE